MLLVKLLNMSSHCAAFSQDKEQLGLPKRYVCGKQVSHGIHVATLKLRISQYNP